MRWIFLVLCLFIIGCEAPEYEYPYEGIITRDVNGNVYVIERASFGNYDIYQLDIQELRAHIKELK